MLEPVCNGSVAAINSGNMEEVGGAVDNTGSILPVGTETGMYELRDGSTIFEGTMTGVKVLVSGTSERTATPTKTLS